MFKSKTQPLCRYCGKRIAKHTTTVRFGERDAPGFRKDKPLTLAAAQRLVNEQIVSHRWTTPTRLTEGDFEPTGEPRYISQVYVWDGETYVDPFFCNGDHARSFGYASARSGQVMPAYRDAMQKRGQPKQIHMGVAA